MADKMDIYIERSLRLQRKTNRRLTCLVVLAAVGVYYICKNSKGVYYINKSSNEQKGA